jgi:hypothetical protein
MREQSGSLLKLLCLALAALVFFQFSRLWLRRNSLGEFRSAAPSFQSAAGVDSRKDPDTNSTSRPQTQNPPPPVPPAVQARIDRVTQSEILAPVIRPLPMALLGIAGRDAFLRAPNGQTGLIREGEDLGGIKLLRIGTNRVLIEHEGQKKELLMFGGFGSETLLPKG